jgi:hypothetical protein
VEIRPYLETWNCPLHSIRASADDVAASANSAVTASVVKPLARYLLMTLLLATPRL